MRRRLLTKLFKRLSGRTALSAILAIRRKAILISRKSASIMRDLINGCESTTACWLVSCRRAKNLVLIQLTSIPRYQLAVHALRQRATATRTTARWDFMSEAECDATMMLVEKLEHEP